MYSDNVQIYSDDVNLYNNSAYNNNNFGQNNDNKVTVTEDNKARNDSKGPKKLNSVGLSRVEPCEIVQQSPLRTKKKCKFYRFGL